jgi:hypothetical protein
MRIGVEPVRILHFRTLAECRPTRLPGRSQGKNSEGA